MKRIYWFLIVVSFFCIIKYLGLFELWNYRPQSAHQWRQCDGLSIYLSYFNNLNPFQPAIMNQMEGNGQTVSEFPIFYYISALFSKITLYKEGILRLVHFIVLMIGFGYFFNWILQSTNNFIYAASSSLILFSSPVLVYYSFNFLPDGAALGCCIASMAMIEISHQNETAYPKPLIFFLILTVLLKPPLLLYPILLIAITVVEKRAFPKNALQYSMISLSCGVLWMFLSSIYKSIHHNDYFLNRLMPLWNYDRETILQILNRIIHQWLWMYFSKPVWLLICFFIAVTVICLFFSNNKSQIFKIIIFSSIPVIIFILWFYQFNDHDYYFLMLIPFFAFLLVYSYQIIKSIHFTFTITALLTVSCFSQLHYSKVFLWNRFDSNNEFQKDAFPLYMLSREAIQQKLTALGIEKDAKILVLGDGSTNTSLYYLERQGWTNYNLKEEKIKPEQAIDTFRKRGAKFAFVTKEFGISSLTGVSSPVGQLEMFNIFKLTN